jgi:hypothetical protein
MTLNKNYMNISTIKFFNFNQNYYKIILTGIPVEALFNKRYDQILVQIDNMFQMTSIIEFYTQMLEMTNNVLALTFETHVLLHSAERMLGLSSLSPSCVRFSSH